ncbi:MAG: class A beta-lactamase-related serine hydrolase [Acholeplasmatales bacterium]|nr:MAG: class A beta-lactamase-related serine hydrolase [Acholeplasmatales bacterium]
MTFRKQHQTYWLKRVQDLKKKKHIHHILMAAESFDGAFKVAYHEGSRDTKGTPIEADTPFMIASVTKLFIATTILKLHEQGKLDIMAPLYNYLDQALIAGIHVYKGKTHDQDLRLWHLLTHTSGIRDYIEIKDTNKQTIFDRVIKGEDQTFEIADMLQLLKDSKCAHFPPQAYDAPRKKARYSDTNFQLLRAVIEQLTNASCDTVFKQLIFEPLGMKQTFLPGSEDERADKDVAELWVMTEPLNRPLALRSFGDYYSTTADLITFMRHLMRGDLFDQAETLAMMMNDFHTFGVSISPVAPAWPIAYSKGMMRFNMPKLFSGFKRMPTAYGHTGVGSAFLFYVPELELILTGTVGQIRYTALPFQWLPKVLIGLKNMSH